MLLDFYVTLVVGFLATLLCFFFFSKRLVVFFPWGSSRSSSFPLEGKHVCVTGGSEGIGLSVALESVARGASIVTLLARDGQKLRNAVNFITRSCTGVGRAAVTLQAIPCDVTDPDAVTTVFQALHGASTPANLNPYIKTLIKNQAILEPSSLAVHQPVDVLVAAAGSCICDTFDRLSAADLDSQLRVNVLGALYPCQQLFKLAIEENDHTRRQRAVVLLASIAAQLNIYGFVGYGAAKFALRGAWEALTMEGDPLGIRVLCAFPPSTETPGYIKECLRKPSITAAIEGAGGLYSSRTVASKILTCVEDGQSRRITFGVAGRLVAALTHGMAPISRVRELLVDILLYFPAKITGFVLSFYWTYVIRSATKQCVNEKNKREVSKPSQS